MPKFMIALLIALLAGPAFAQGRSKGGGGKRAAPDQNSEQKKKDSDKLDKDYKATLDRLPDKEFDPWGAVRANSADKPQK